MSAELTRAAMKCERPDCFDEARPTASDFAATSASRFTPQARPGSPVGSGRCAATPIDRALHDREASKGDDAVEPMPSWPPGAIMRTARVLVLGFVGGLLLCAGCARPPRGTISPAAPVMVGDEQTGMASWYGTPYHGRRTASGEVYDMNQMTAAHRTLPFGTWVLVENLLNGQTVELRITDRGPFSDTRILDLSAAAARVLGAIARGTIPIHLRVIRLAGAPPPSIGSATVPTAFTVQVAAFTDASRAQGLRDTLARDGIEDVYVQSATVAGQGLFYRVRVGKYPERPAADAMAQRLAGAGYAVLIVAE